MNYGTKVDDVQRASAGYARQQHIDSLRRLSSPEHQYHMRLHRLVADEDSAYDLARPEQYHVDDLERAYLRYHTTDELETLKEKCGLVRKSSTILQRWPSVEELADGLWQLLDTQQQVSSRVPDCIPEPGVRPTKQQVANYGQALIHEVGELMDELGWSPWKDQKPIDRARVLDEYADVLAFLGVITVYVQRATGATVQEMAEAYLKKTRVNVERLSGNVDGYRQNGER